MHAERAMKAETQDQAVERVIAVSRATLLRGDFDGFEQLCTLPQLVTSLDGAARSQTPEDLRDVFDRTTRYFKDRNVSDLHREVCTVVSDGPDSLRVAFITHLIVDGTRLGKPVFGAYRLERIEGQFKLTEQHFASDLVFTAVKETPAALPDILNDPDEAPRVVMAQAFLNRYSNNILENRFEDSLPQIRQPFLLHGPDLTLGMQSQDDLRVGFLRHKVDLKMQGVSDVVRTLYALRRIDENSFHLVYRTHVLSGCTLLIPSIRSTMILRREDRDSNWTTDGVINPIGRLDFARMQRDRGPALP